MIGDLHGLALRGAFHPAPEDGVPLPAGTLVLLGLVGAQGWDAFAASPEAGDGAPDPLDRWSRRVIGAIAVRLGGTALFPFDGPPWLPFQRWALRAERVFASPLGLLVHPVHGLWHSYRGAVALPERLPLPVPRAAAHPCEACAARPCLAACPVGAFSPQGYDVAACAAHASRSDCRELGCHARLACPVGAAHAYGAGQTRFHMRAFLASRGG